MPCPHSFTPALALTKAAHSHVDGGGFILRNPEVFFSLLNPIHRSPDRVILGSLIPHSQGRGT